MITLEDDVEIYMLCRIITDEERPLGVKDLWNYMKGTIRGYDPVNSVNPL